MRRHRPKCWWSCASRIRVRGHNKFSSGRSDEFLQGLHFLLFCCLFWVFSEPLTRWRRCCCFSSSHAAWAYLFCPLGSLVGCAALFAVAAARLKCARQRNYLMHVSPFCQDFYLHCVTCGCPPLTQSLPVSASCLCVSVCRLPQANSVLVTHLCVPAAQIFGLSNALPLQHLQQLKI